MLTDTNNSYLPHPLAIFDSVLFYNQASLTVEKTHLLQTFSCLAGPNVGGEVGHRPPLHTHPIADGKAAHPQLADLDMDLVLLSQLTDNL